MPKSAPDAMMRLLPLSDTTSDIVAGGCAGMANTIAMYPTDTIRTRLQVSGGQGKLQGVGACASDIFRNEGTRGFYKGMAFPLGAQVIFKIVIFATNGIARRATERWGLEDSPARTFACGAVSGGVNALFVAPVELVRTRLMLQVAGDSGASSSRSKGPFDCVRRIVRSQGLLGLCQGLGVTVTRDSLGMGAFFLSFEKAQRALTRHRYGRIPEGRPSDADILLASGSIAGLSYWIVALPFDMAKTIIQATRLDRGEPLPAMVSTLARLLREGGLQRLYMGWPVALGRGIPGSAILLATHAYVIRALGPCATADGNRLPMS